MTLPEPWANGFLAGLASLLLMSFLPWIPPIVVLTACAAGALGDRRLAVSGALVGFGGLWLVLIASQLVSGGQSDTYPMAIAFGLVTLLAGFVVAGIGRVKEWGSSLR
jgi:hypothetical protein